MTGPDAPLIANADPDFDADSDYDEAPVGGKTLEPPPGLFIWLLTLSAGMSGILFGYDTGVISATLVSIGDSLSHRELSSIDKSIITSSTALLALLVSPLSSTFADLFGRKRVILFADVFFMLGAVVQACSNTVFAMVVGRGVVGAAVGAASFVVPLYIAEMAPAAHRGRLVTTYVLFITIGQVLAYVIGWAFAEHGTEGLGWRWMVLLGAVPAAVQAFCLLFMPETPRWLVMDGRSVEAREVIQRVLGGRRGAAKLADATLKSIAAEIEQDRLRHDRRQRTSEQSNWFGSFGELLATRRNRRALAIACLLQGLQQLCGFNSLMYYSATIFTLLGFSMPTLTSLVVAVTNFVFTVTALFLIDRIGRRRILLYSIPFMVAGLLLSAYGFSFIQLPSSSDAAPPTTEGAPSTRGAALLILFSITAYVAAYAIGLGNVPWMQSELFPLSVRALGSGVATATNWGANFIIGLTFLPLMDALTPPWTFTLYAVICAIGYVLIWRVYPETTGLSLEEAAGLLDDDRWGVR